MVQQTPRHGDCSINRAQDRKVTMKNVFHVEPNSPCDFGEYRVTIEKHGEFYRCIQYSNMSGTAMMDIVPSLRKKYPSTEGYKVSW